ncbi:MAG: aminotransferase class V-fold PLP-dependent enzyme, partial [Candidatus Tectomicrobia bacterium]|nr:aminotransferase class V-fold PLP-dependent enzyme [Candidatus Tectomicrobia bacterium]
MRKVYLDNNATTSLAPEVLEAMLPFYREEFGNPSSIHAFGRGVRVAIDEAREAVAHLLGAEPGEIVFTSGGTEADNFAIKGIAYACQESGRHIITSTIEHPAVLNTCQYLEERGFRVTYLPVDGQGLVDPEDLRKAIDRETILITIMHANNETGALQPIRAIGEIAQERGICFHTDAVQSVGKFPFQVKELGVDLLSLSAHKIHGPKGVGALYLKKGTRLHPLLHGGHHEHGWRAGTENTAGIAGLGRACRLAAQGLSEEAQRLTALRDRLEQGIQERIPQARLNGHPTQRLPNTLNCSFWGVEGESLL